MQVGLATPQREGIDYTRLVHQGAGILGIVSECCLPHKPHVLISVGKLD